MIFNEVINYWRQVHERENYYEIKTPIILNKELWKRSGHWKNYRANMYFTRIDNNGYAVKPMNCPGGLLLFKEKMWSYKDFPVKFAELGLVHRHEKAGVLHGLFRVRQFTQDDAHVFCLFNQVEEEVAKIIDLVIEIYSNFGFYDYMIELSTRPKKSIGSTRDWKIAEECLENALKSKNIDYKINKGEGAFYGPKIDFHITDCLKRTWQCGTIQVDFSMPKRFNLEYVTETGTKKKPVMIHRAILGSIERFVGVLIEHYGGDLPLWLAPTQILIIPVSERFHEYAIRIENLLKNNGFRVNNDIRNEKVGYKIREGELSKVNYMLIVGEREEKDETVSVRKRKKGDLGVMKLVEFVDTIKMERDNRN
jgi:threonyl-tRNA synthetase